MADSKLVRECDGSKHYSPFKDDIEQYAVLQDFDYVLHNKCPEPIAAAFPAGAFGEISSSA